MTVDNKMAAGNSDKEDAKEIQVQLRREFGLIQGVAVIVGLVIGSGIYISPTGVLRQVPSAGLALILWVLAGVVSTLGALTFAEIGTTIPVAGEKYAYLKLMYGDFVAFVQLWQYFIFYRPAANTLKCIVFATYVLKPVFQHCEIPSSIITLVAISLLTLFAYVNSSNVKLTAVVQAIFTFLTVTTLMIISVISWFYLGRGNSTFLSPSVAFQGVDNLSASNIILGIYSAMFPYVGWFGLNFMVEELKDPYKNLPKAIVISMTLICSIYILVNIAYLAALGVDGVIASEAVVISFAEATLGKWSMWLFAVLIAVNNLSSLNSGILIASRLGFAGGRNGHLPKLFGLIHITYRTPIPAILLQFLVAFLMCLLVDLYDLVNQMVSLLLLFDFITVVGIIRMRLQKPDIERPIKLPLIIPISYAVITFSMLVIALVIAPRKTGMGLLIVLSTAVPYYVLFVKDIFKSKTINRYSDNFLRFTQKMLNAVLQEGEIAS